MATVIRALKDLHNEGKCFSRGKDYTVDKDIHELHQLMNVTVINDNGQPHTISTWYKHFEIVPSKRFMYKDKTGRGISNPNFTLDDVLSCEDELNYSGDSLHEWANECDESDEWENATMKFICLEVN